MKTFLLAAALFFMPSIVNAQGYYQPHRPYVNHSNNFGNQIYGGFYNGNGYVPGLSYYGNSQFYSYDYYGGRQWIHQGNFIRGYNYGYGSYYPYGFANSHGGYRW